MVSSSISTPGEEGTYTFTANAGENAQIRITDTSNNDFCPEVALYGPGGNFIVSIGNDNVAVLDREVVENGTYTVVVSGGSANEDKTGDYDLELRIFRIITLSRTGADDGWYTGNDRTTITLGADQGAWLQIRSGNGPVNLYFLGEVSSIDRTIPINTGMNLVGTCFPFAVNMVDTNLWESGLTGSGFEGAADRVWSWVDGHYEFIWLGETGTAFDGQWYKGNDPVDRSLNPGSGFWIQRRDNHYPFDWNYLNH